LDTEIHEPEQASLFVLNGTTMPAVLVEVGYLSNPRESRKLRDSGYLEQIALALSEGIEQFVESLESHEVPVE
jgi:N-acetylmuramoyl-L-alanine amidase